MWIASLHEHSIALCALCRLHAVILHRGEECVACEPNFAATQSIDVTARANREHNTARPNLSWGCLKSLFFMPQDHLAFDLSASKLSHTRSNMLEVYQQGREQPLPAFAPLRAAYAGVNTLLQDQSCL